jgi:hypothetical protein
MLREEDLQPGINYTSHVPARGDKKGYTFYMGTYTNELKDNIFLHRFSKMQATYSWGHFDSRDIVFEEGDTSALGYFKNRGGRRKTRSRRNRRSKSSRSKSSRNRQ